MVYIMEICASEHSKCVSIFENEKKEMDEHPLALENGNADTGHLCCKYSAYILYCVWPGASSGLL